MADQARARASRRSPWVRELRFIAFIDVTSSQAASSGDAITLGGPAGGRAVIGRDGETGHESDIP